jgi:hypothetical protein
MSTIMRSFFLGKHPKESSQADHLYIGTEGNVAKCEKTLTEEQQETNR